MTRRRKKHRPDEIVAKLRDADAMLNAGKDLAADASTLTYTGTGGIITGTLGGTPFTDATWSITGTANPTNVVTGTGSIEGQFVSFTFLAMTPLLTIATGSSTLQANMVTTGSTG